MAQADEWPHRSRESSYGAAAGSIAWRIAVAGAIADLRRGASVLTAWAVPIGWTWARSDDSASPSCSSPRQMALRHRRRCRQPGSRITHPKQGRSEAMSARRRARSTIHRNLPPPTTLNKSRLGLLPSCCALRPPPSLIGLRRVIASSCEVQRLPPTLAACPPPPPPWPSAPLSRRRTAQPA